MDSELLFILIIILTVVINIVKVVKKKKAQLPKVTQPEPAEKSGEGDWQKMLRDLLGETESKPKPVSFEEEDQLESLETLETLEPLGGYIRDNIPYSFEEPEYSRSTISDEVFDVQSAISAVPETNLSKATVPASFVHGNLKDFNIRKAVIYSTILNRPYN